MALFGKKKEKQSQSYTVTRAPEPPQKVLRSITYPYSSVFKGTRRCKLAAYGSATAQAGIDALKIPNPAKQFDPNEQSFIFNFNGAKITIQEVEYGYPGTNGRKDRFLKVFVGPHHIGSIFQPYIGDYAPYASALIWGRAELVHIKIEPTSVVFTNEKGEMTIGERYNPYIFVKIKEE